jgi:putative MFS transporter
MFDAWDILLTGFLIPLVADGGWQLSKLDLGIFGSAALFGMAIGAFSWGTIADRLGRKQAFSLTLLTFAVFSLLAAAAPTFSWLVVCRFISGIGLGGCIPVDYSMVAEFTPRKLRGRVLTAMDVWWPIGATISGLVSTVLAPFNSWRLLLLIMVVPALLVFWVRRSIPESPLYLLRKGRAQEARTIIHNLIARTGAPADFRAFSLPPEQTQTKAAPIRSIWTQLRDLWSWNWKLTLLAWSLFFTIFFEYYGVITWLPTVLKREGYSTEIAFLETTFMTGIGIVGVILAAFLVDWFGRRWIIILSALVSAMAIVLFTVSLHMPTQAIFWIGVFGFTNEIVAPSIYCYVPELYPTLMRATGFGWGSTMSRIGAALVPVIFGTILWPIIGLEYTFILMGVLILAATVWLYFVGPETKGRLLDDDSGDDGLVGRSVNQSSADKVDEASN